MAVRDGDVELAQKIEDQMFTFNDLMKLDNKAIQLVLRETNNETLVIALKGAEPELREKMLANMSTRAAETLREDIESKGPVRVSEVEAQQKDMLKLVRRLSDAITAVHAELQAVRRELPPDAPSELAAFIDVHALILSDPIIAEDPLRIIRSRHYNAEWALLTQIDELSAQFDEIEDAYLRERKNDIRQVGERVLLNTNTITPLLKRLEQLGLVERLRRTTDERVVEVHLTAAGLGLKAHCNCFPSRLLESTQFPLEKAAALKQLLDELVLTLRSGSENQTVT